MTRAGSTIGRGLILFLAVAIGLDAALTGSGADAPPKDPKPRPANRLAQEASPYLRQHGHNPVDWYPWGPEAFARARKEKKLVFLSIGYSSCFWCHVMERESFDHPEVAKLLNQWFVCIKVDREERPDIDTIYMTALHALGQRGGWPLSMFLTADGKPIVGGTYWPREDREIEGQKVRGFKSILKFVKDWHTDKTKEVEEQADTLAERTAEVLSMTQRGMPLIDLDRNLVQGALDALKEEFDPVHGGFGSRARKFQGTKFPVPPYLVLLANEAARSKSADLTGMLTLTLDRMAQGGICDQLGGGFHRYGTERTWTVPHFEKMLYDNAQLLEVYAQAYQLTRQPQYRRVIQETIAFVAREMTSPEGGFWSALDAETDAEEGRFYVWTDKELTTALVHKEDLELIRKVYGIGADPNFESKYHILVLPRLHAEAAKDLKLTEAQLEARLGPLRRTLFEVRNRRARPFLDTKVLTAWNGQMIAGYARAGQVLDDPAYVRAAAGAADLVLAKLRTKEGRLLRSYAAKPGEPAQARLMGYLEDYAFLTHGLLNLHDATQERKWLDEARNVTDRMIEFHLDKSGGFFTTAHDHEKLFARSKDQYDGAQPSGNSMAARNLTRLWIKTGEDRYRTLAERTIKTFAGALKTNPSGMTMMADALALYLDRKEGPVARPDKDPPAVPDARGSAKVVKAAAVADKPNEVGLQNITVTLTIDKGWHIYANPGPKDFGEPTRVVLGAKEELKDIKIDYPQGELRKDRTLGEYRVYANKVTIKASVRRIGGDAGPLSIVARFMACDEEGKCLLPASVKLSVR